MLLKIGALARVTNTRTQSVIHYERAGLMVEPIRTKGNHRLYGEEGVHRLRFIRRARELGFSLDQIKDLLELAQGKSQPGEPKDAMGQRYLADLDQRIVDLQAIRAELSAAINDPGGENAPLNFGHTLSAPNS